MAAARDESGRVRTCGVDQPERGPLHGNGGRKDPGQELALAGDVESELDRVDGIRQEREDVPEVR